MIEYEPKYFSRVTEEIQAMTDLANVHNESVRMKFNGTIVVAKPGDEPSALYAKYRADRVKRIEEYARSPKGVQAAREAEERLQNMQAGIDALMIRFGTLDYANLEELVQFFDDLTDPSDHIGVVFNRLEIVTQFEAHGYAVGANVGPDFDEGDREVFGRYLIGQALSCLVTVGAIHHIYHDMAQKWREKFVPVNSGS